jgi:hypothetical protein
MSNTALVEQEKTIDHQNPKTPAVPKPNTNSPGNLLDYRLAIQQTVLRNAGDKKASQDESANPSSSPGATVAHNFGAKNPGKIPSTR